MLYKRIGYPEDEEIVLCKVTSILPSSVFVELVEYHRPGLVHISEVAPGRIRNLRDFVSLDRQIICKVLRIDREKGHIDLSIRRVNSHQRREKLDEIKQETNAETILQNLSKKISIPLETLYQKVSQAAFKEYSHLYLCFQDVAAGTINLEKLGVEKNIAQELTTIILEKFKPSRIFVEGELKLQTYHSDGIDRIKNILQQIEAISPKIKITYLGAGRFKIVLEDVDYKPAEKNLQKISDLAQAFNDKLSTASFEREKKAD